MANWDFESPGRWWMSSNGDYYEEKSPDKEDYVDKWEEEKEEEEYEKEIEDKKKSLEEILREYESQGLQNPWYEVRREDRTYESEEEEEEDEEIKGHIESFIEAFKVPRNKQKRVKEILRKKNSERTQEEKDFLKQFIIKAKNIQKPKIEIVRQDDNEPNDDEEELSEEEIEEAISNEERIESLKNKLYDYYEKATDLSPKGWPDLADPRGYYDWGTLDFEEALKKMSR